SGASLSAERSQARVPSSRSIGALTLEGGSSWMTRRSWPPKSGTSGAMRSMVTRSPWLLMWDVTTSGIGGLLHRGEHFALTPSQLPAHRAARFADEDDHSSLPVEPGQRVAAGGQEVALRLWYLERSLV